MLSFVPVLMVVASFLAPRAEPSWSAHVDPAGQIYPSMVFAMSTVKKQEPFIDLRDDE